MTQPTESTYLDEALELARRYFDGCTSLAEERRLRQLLADPSLKGHELLDEARAVTGYALFAPHAATERTSRPRRMRWAAAASVAAVAAVTAAVLLAPGATVTAAGGDSDCVAYVGGRKVTDRQTVLAMVNDDLAQFAVALDDVNEQIDGQLAEFQMLAADLAVE